MISRFLKLGTMFACFLAVTVLLTGCPQPADDPGPDAADEEAKPCLMQITADGKLEPYFADLPIHAETETVCPLGIDFGSDGNLYIADAQAIAGHAPYKSRILKLTVEEGKPTKCEVVVEGINFANAIACHGDAVYLTETQLEGTPDPDSPHKSGVYRFEIAELDPAKPIKIEPDGADPHLVYQMTTENEELRVGANGLGFAKDGKMYVCNFGNQSLVEVEFAADDPKKVVHERVVAAGDPMKSTDGLKVGEDGMVYIADFLGNAVHQVDPATGKVTVLAQNEQTTGEGGELDACSEVCLRDGKVYVANIDLAFGPNTADAPYTVSVFDLASEEEDLRTPTIACEFTKAYNPDGMTITPDGKTIILSCLTLNAPAEETPAEDPPAVDPPAVDPPAVDPPAVDPPAVDPPAVDPPAVDPPSVDPPSVDPPSVDPPSVDPPSVDPPSVDPPAVDAPTTE